MAVFFMWYSVSAKASLASLAIHPTKQVLRGPRLSGGGPLEQRWRGVAVGVYLIVGNGALDIPPY